MTSNVGLHPYSWAETPARSSGGRTRLFTQVHVVSLMVPVSFQQGRRKKREKDREERRNETRIMCAVTEPLTALFESNETLSQRMQEFLWPRFVFVLRSGPSIQGFFLLLFGRAENAMRKQRWMEEERNLPLTGCTKN